MRSALFAFAVVSLLVSSGPHAQAAPILVARYVLDETGTQIYDSSGYIEAGAQILANGSRSASRYSSGELGVTHVQGTAAARFTNSSSDSINLGSPDKLDFIPQVDEFTIAAWIGNVPGGTIFSKAVGTGADRQYQLFVDGGDTTRSLRAYIGGAPTNATSILASDEIYHVAMTVSTSQVTLYVNGVQDGQGSVGEETNLNQTVYIGARTDGNGFKVTGGWIDDVQVYSGVLSANEVAYLSRNAGISLPDVDVVYREVFPNSSGSNRTFGGGTVEGWKAHYTTAGIASSGTAISGEEGSRRVVPLNSNPDHTSLTNGYYSRSQYAGNYLHWTEEFAMDDVADVRFFQWDQRNDSLNDIFHVAVRLDVDGTLDTSDDKWYASVQTFTNADAQSTFTNALGHEWYLDLTFDFLGAKWLELDFVPDTTLGLDLQGNQITLPSGVAMTGFGFYTPNVPGFQRFDNFRILVPEPGTVGLLACGLITLVLPRRRRRYATKPTKGAITMKSLPFILAAFALLALTGLQAQAAPVLVARYTLDETGTSIFDWSGNGLHGTRGVDNASTGTRGTNYIQGSAAAAFGNNSQHSINLGSPDILDFQPGVDEFSISAWFRVPSSTSGTLVSKAVNTGSDRQYQLLIGSNKLQTYLGGTASSYGSTTVTDNQVHHVVWSVTALGYNVYLDGNLTPEISGSSIGSKLNAGQDVYIGARTDGSGYMLTGGWIDDVQFYQGALTAAQASHLYNNPGDWIPTRVLAYRETFPNDSGSDRRFDGGAVEGWKAHYTAAGIVSEGTVISGGVGSRPLTPFNSSPDHSSLTNGYYSRSAYAANYLHWTEEFAIDNVDHVRSFQWDQRNGSQDLFHVAVRLDVDGTPDTADDIWYASVQTFTNADVTVHTPESNEGVGWPERWAWTAAVR